MSASEVYKIHPKKKRTREGKKLEHQQIMSITSSKKDLLGTLLGYKKENFQRVQGLFGMFRQVKEGNEKNMTIYRSILVFIIQQVRQKERGDFPHRHLRDGKNPNIHGQQYKSSNESQLVLLAVAV